MVCARMTRNVPTGSVSGAADWEWNRLYGKRKELTSAEAELSHGSVGSEQRSKGRMPGRTGNRRNRNRELLARELERCVHRNQHLINHYERLISQKQQRLTEQTQGEAEPDNRSFDPIAVIRRILTR